MWSSPLSHSWKRTRETTLANCLRNSNSIFSINTQRAIPSPPRHTRRRCLAHCRMCDLRYLPWAPRHTQTSVRTANTWTMRWVIWAANDWWRFRMATRCAVRSMPFENGRPRCLRWVFFYKPFYYLKTSFDTQCIIHQPPLCTFQIACDTFCLDTDQSMKNASLSLKSETFTVDNVRMVNVVERDPIDQKLSRYHNKKAIRGTLRTNSKNLHIHSNGNTERSTILVEIQAHDVSSRPVIYCCEVLNDKYFIIYFCFQFRWTMNPAIISESFRRTTLF